jgi:hypothetical protein
MKMERDGWGPEEKAQSKNILLQNLCKKKEHQFVLKQNMVYLCTSRLQSGQITN